MNIGYRESLQVGYVDEVRREEGSVALDHWHPMAFRLYILADFKPLSLTGMHAMHELQVPQNSSNPVGKQELVKTNAI